MGAGPTSAAALDLDEILGALLSSLLEPATRLTPRKVFTVGMNARREGGLNAEVELRLTRAGALPGVSGTNTCGAALHR